MADFLKAFNKIIVNEGGYVNDKDDKGGETFMGITRKNHPNIYHRDEKPSHELKNRHLNL